MPGKKFSVVAGIRVDSAEPTDKEFGRLVKIGRRFKIKAVTFVVVKCECGEVLAVRDSNLNRNTQSCGCLIREIVTKRNTTHGLSKLPEYAVWKSIKGRCLNHSCRDYEDYGGRGITICERWLNSFEAFYSDMGPRPTIRHSVDRIENSSNYEPGNCKWSTQTEQCNNKRSNRILTVNGVSGTVAEWSRISLLPFDTIYSRLKRGWSHFDAVMKPIRKHSKSHCE